jgi:4-amino-4-deoxy-L-arabinose transferase-like glycosyltransferase
MAALAAAQNQQHGVAQRGAETAHGGAACRMRALLTRLDPDLERPRRTSTRWHGTDVLFVAGLSLVHALLWWWANHREGVWLQAPATDQAHDLTTAWLFHRALAALDPDGLVRTWVAGSSVHTPLVPLCSAALMWMFGATRVTAEAILPVFIAIWIVAVYGCLRQLSGPNAARFATALTAAFPVFLIYSRTYLFEQPLAAVFAVACWWLITSDGFRRRGHSVAFGIAAAAVALTRGGGFVLLTGPVLVTLWSIRAAPDRARRWTRCAVALGVAALLASTWYGPNFRAFSDYVRQATYGQDALARTGRTAAFSWDAAAYYVTWLIAQGPGWPMLLLVGAAAAAVFSRGRRLANLSPIAGALGAVFAVDFVILLAGMQRQTARYFLPLMPLVALAIVGIVRRVEWPAARRGLAALVTALALHHVVALSLTFPLGPQPAAAPYVRGIPLWDHRTYFRTLVDFYKLRTSADDFRIAEIVNFLGTLPIGTRAIIDVVGTPHGFFHRNGLQLESIRQQRQWRWLPDTYVRTGTGPLQVVLPEADVVVVRSEGPSGLNRDDLMRAASALADRAVFQSVRSFTLGDGSVAAVFVRVSGPSRAERLPSAPLPRYRQSLFSTARFPPARAAARRAPSVDRRRASRAGRDRRG